MPRILVFLAAAVVLALAGIGGANAQNLTVLGGNDTVTVKSGETIEIGQFVFYDSSNCAVLDIDQVVWAEPPKHGKIITSGGLAAILSNSNPCSGHYTRSLQVYYTSLEGYTGPDSVVFDVVMSNGGYSHKTVSITVVSAGGSAPKTSPAPTSNNPPAQ